MASSYELTNLLGLQGSIVQITFENNLDDVIALNKNLISNNEQFKKRRKWSLYYFPVLLLVSFSVFAYLTNKPSFYGGALGGAIGSFLWSYFCYKNYPKKAASQLKQKEVLCKHTVTLTPEGIRETTEGSENFNKWGALDKVSYSDDHIFIYNTPLTAHMIPKREIGNDNFIKLKNEITALINT